MSIDSPELDLAPGKATYTAMSESTREDYRYITAGLRVHKRALPDRILEHLMLLGGDDSGFPIDRLTHSLQTATRAYRAGRDDEYVLCALLHDIGDTIGSFNHANIAAAVLKPFVSEQNYWMVDHHDVFQGYFWFRNVDLDPNARDIYAGHEHFDYTAEFCLDYDQNSFDANYDTLPIGHFEPLIRDLMSKPKTSIYTKYAMPGTAAAASFGVASS
jgi:predicted HD phosphohydrolase